MRKTRMRKIPSKSYPKPNDCEETAMGMDTVKRPCNSSKSIDQSDIRKTKTLSVINNRRSLHQSFRSISSNNGSLRKRFSAGKSTLILITIVVLFVITHSFRLALKVYMTVFPQFNTDEKFTGCLRLRR